MSNDDPHDFMEPRVREVFIRGQIAREKQTDIRYRVDGFVKHMVALHPEHTDVLRDMLGGAAAELLARKEAAKRAARDAPKKEKQNANGKANGHGPDNNQGVSGGGNGVRDSVREDAGAGEGDSSCEEADGGVRIQPAVSRG